MRKTLVLVLVAGYCSAALGVNASWSEEMTGPPDPAFWTVTGTPADYTSRPGSWYGAKLGMNMSNAAVVRQPLNGKAAYTMDFRFRFSPYTTPPGFNQSVELDQRCRGTQNFAFHAGQIFVNPYNVTAEGSTSGARGGYNALGTDWMYGPAYTAPFAAEEWHLVRAVCDPVGVPSDPANSWWTGTVTLYIDGAQAYQFPYDGPKPYDPNDSPIYFGNGQLGTYPVEWDYLRFYDGVLPNPGTDPLNAMSDRLLLSTTALTGFENSLSGPTAPTYTVVLKSAPAADVTVAIDPNDLINKVTATPASLTFTPSNWSTPQTVTLTVINTDGKATASRTVTVKHHVTSTDQNFDGETRFLDLTVYHDDVYAVLIDPGNGVRVAEQGPTSDTYTLQLLKQPAATPLGNVVVSPNGYAGQVTIAGTANWTRTLWYQKKTFTVTAVNDAVYEAPNPYPVTINHICTGGGGYALLPVDSLTVLVEDNDCGTWGFNFWDKDHNCVVNVLDLAALAAAWLNCTQPFGVGCVNLAP